MIIPYPLCETLLPQRRFLSWVLLQRGKLLMNKTSPSRLAFRAIRKDITTNKSWALLGDLQFLRTLFLYATRVRRPALPYPHPTTADPPPHSQAPAPQTHTHARASTARRSEERRVGKAFRIRVWVNS